MSGVKPRAAVPHLLAIAALLATIMLSGCADTWGGDCTLRSTRCYRNLVTVNFR